MEIEYSYPLSQQTRFVDLPCELIEEIAQYLDNHTILSLNATNTQCYDALESWASHQSGTADLEDIIQYDKTYLFLKLYYPILEDTWRDQFMQWDHYLLLALETSPVIFREMYLISRHQLHTVTFFGILDNSLNIENIPMCDFICENNVFENHITNISFPHTYLRQIAIKQWKKLNEDSFAWIAYKIIRSIENPKILRQFAAGMLKLVTTKNRNVYTYEFNNDQIKLVSNLFINFFDAKEVSEVLIDMIHYNNREAFRNVYKNAMNSESFTAKDKEAFHHYECLYQVSMKEENILDYLE